MNAELVIYSRAKQAIAEYKTVDEVKDFRDKAVAIEAYARQANDMELEWDAAKARVRAERRCGELLREMEKAKGVRMNGKDEHGSAVVHNDHRTKTLSEMGLTKDQSSKWQKLAAVPEDEFERAITIPGAKPSTNHILKEQKEPEQRMDADALWLWGTLRDMRKNKIFDKPVEQLVSEWTDAMKEDVESIISQLNKWVSDYE